MPLYKNMPEPSGRMGLLWTLGTIKDAAILEFGSMGHMLYAEKWMSQTGISDRSKLFTTHLDEKDIALGITKRFENAMKEIAEDKSIKAVFVLPSTVPEMIGIDLEAICLEVQEEYPNLIIVPLGCGNFKATKEKGIEEGLYQLVKAIPQRSIKNKNFREIESKNRELKTDEKKIQDVKIQDVKIQEAKIEEKKIEENKIRYNIIGSVCDMARFRSDAREIVRILNSAFPMEEICTMTTDTSVSELEGMGLADINIVLRKEGLKAAKEMERNYGIPYFYGSPYGYEGTKQWLTALGQLIEREVNRNFLSEELKEGEYTLNTCKFLVQFKKERAKIWLEGHEDVVKGISEFAVKEIGFQLDKGGIFMANEKDIKLSNAQFGIAVERSLDSTIFNKYESPFMGFRGAMKLCSLWNKLI